ncbi:MAG TPA: glycerophosphodiester phosphodiesterase [Fibrobacteria bacterium]|nr:glycerophosphodiester phosphodiesterase [Fibrobacteria bacterium]
MRTIRISSGGTAMSPSVDVLHRPLAIGHRGWHKSHIENTLDAFREAYEAGCDMVEFDVQLSRDGVPFVFHDDDGVRLAQRKERVFDLDWKDLREWVLPPRLEARKGGKPGGYRMPTLEDFLTEFGSKSFYLEMKVPRLKHGDKRYYEALGRACADLVTQSRPSPHTFLASFHAPILEFLGRSQAFPHRVGIHEALSSFREALATGTPSVERHSLSWRVWGGYLKSAASIVGQLADPGKILIWDIHNRADMVAARAAGIHALVADDVETMVEVCR